MTDRIVNTADVLGRTALALLALALAPTPLWAQVRAEAVAGRPFGVGRIALQSPANAPDTQSPGRLLIQESQNRVFYPAASSPNNNAGKVAKDILNRTRRPIGQIISGFLDDSDKASVYFLFRGDGPLDLTVGAQPPLRMSVTPVAHPAAHNQLMAAWWKAYAAPQGLGKKADYPPIVENYLQTMLTRRLGLQTPPGRTGDAWQGHFEQQLGLQLDTEAIRVAMQQQRMLGRSHLEEQTSLPLPPSVSAAESVFPPTPENVQIEPLAMHVPVECLYVRFGSFTNFLWFQDTLDRWGGDIRNLVAQRGISYGLNQRTQKQLVLQQSALGRLFGEAAVADAAIVGSDMFLPEGAAMGLLFQARNSLLFGSDVQRQRREALKQNPTAREEQVTIQDRKVSFLSSADGIIRSYYVADGDFHFVTNSRHLAERFLQVSKGQGALGASQEFRHARAQMPLDRKDTVFAYLSDAMFRNMAGPAYRIETTRRLQAAADIELAQLALLASATEGSPGDNLQQLVQGGFLPPDFGQRPDGSQTILGDHGIHDSVRGARGFFTPVPDVEVRAVTPSEAAAYARFSAYYLAKWGKIDPIMAGLRRELLDGGKRERVFVDVQMSPLNSQTYNFLASKLGRPDQVQLAPVRGDALSFDVILHQQRLFGGFRDFGPPTDAAGEGLLAAVGLLPFGRLRDFLYGYVGTVDGSLGLLDFLNRRIVTPPDAQGYSATQREIWRRQYDRFTVYSLHHEILAEVTPQLRFEPAPRPAQFRLRVGDISENRMAPLANRWLFTRSRETSLGNLRLIHAMMQQLHVPGEDAKAAAETVLDGTLVCPLGGEYAYRKSAQGGGWWTSTALEQTGARSTPPPNFQAPPLSWFRGLDLDAILTPSRLSAHAEVDMQLPK